MQNDTISTWSKNLKDPKSLAIKKVLGSLTNIDTNLLIYGETGVGKDFWINYLYNLSNYPGMLNLHCGDVPENLLESEWFGYRKGAFTGAHKDQPGKWKQAGKGILFLNRIDLLSLNLQAKLLRIIERKKFFPLGSYQEEDVEARFIFSADADIEQKVRDGEFRQDLYYRISAYRLPVPPLRERRKDILPLFNFFARQKGLALSLSRDATHFLTHYPWRGNIRELQNVITNLSIGRTVIEDNDIFSLLKSPQDFLDSIQQREPTMAEVEKEYIHYLLRKYKNKTKVAKIMAIARKSLYNKLDSYK